MARGDRNDPYTEEELAEIWVGGAPPKLTAPIVVADYDPGWPALFAREEARIRSLLGERALLIEHVGSTSVPGLPAKPIIDLDLVVADSADEEAYLPALVAAGYRLVIREPQWYEHRCCKGPDTNINLHIFSPGSAEVERHLLFRDWLRGHQADRHRYAAAKRELASREWTYIQQYADAKTDVITEILARARAAAPPAG
ncbi:MAG TPA: GrpB family protein [Mycobacteriales bacterium]|nr:GrpB family protein [Mycobacteriales bacterium]